MDLRPSIPLLVSFIDDPLLCSGQDARKALPAWIREGLEKAEKEKAKKAEKEAAEKAAQEAKEQRRREMGKGRFVSSMSN